MGRFLDTLMGSGNLPPTVSAMPTSVCMTQNVYYGRSKIRREVAAVLDGNIG